MLLDSRAGVAELCVQITLGYLRMLPDLWVVEAKLCVRVSPQATGLTSRDIRIL